MKNKDEGFYLATPDDEEGIALQGVRVDVRIEGVLAHTTIEQKFRNDSKEAIEALYAFPLPLGATLLGLSIEIAGKKLTGMVQAKRAAETTYEEAVVQGNGAFLLRELDAGRYQMAIGNLKPNCSRRLNFDPPCRLNIDPGRVAVF